MSLSLSTGSKSKRNAGIMLTTLCFRLYLIFRTPSHLSKNVLARASTPLIQVKTLRNVIVPGVTGVAIYAFLESDISKYGIKGSRIIFDCIDKALLENVHVTKHGKFIYFDAEDCKTKKKLAQELDKKFSENGENFRDRSGSETELKLAYSDLSLSIVTKLI